MLENHLNLELHCEISIMIVRDRLQVWAYQSPETRTELLGRWPELRPGFHEMAKWGLRLAT